MYKYEITITSGADIPADVLVEHISYAMRALDPGRGGVSISSKKADVEFTSADPHATYPSTSVRNHPFDGPEMFDDEPAPPNYANGGYLEGSFEPAGTVDSGYVIPKSEVGEMWPQLSKTLQAMSKRAQERDNG